MTTIVFEFELNERAFIISKEKGIREVVVIKCSAEISQRGTEINYSVANVCNKAVSIVSATNIVRTYEEASVLYQNQIKC